MSKFFTVKLKRKIGVKMYYNSLKPLPKDILIKLLFEVEKTRLKLYHVSRPEQCGYGVYAEFVTAAYSEDEARKTHPRLEEHNPHSYQNGLKM